MLQVHDNKAGRYWYGWVDNRKTRAEAEEGAMSFCHKYGPRCTVWARFTNTCIALAATDTGNGTGWLVGKNKFITNAHVISNGTKLMIRMTNDPTPREARVLHVAHDCDLAMIEAVDPKPFALPK